MLVVPIACLLLFGGARVGQRWWEAIRMERVSRLAHVSVRAGELLHHTQRERGLSAAMLGAHRDRIFRARLSEERGQTDASLALFRSAVETLGEQDLGEGAARAFSRLGGSLPMLPSRRGEIDAGGITGAQVVTDYSEMNRQILDMVTEMARASESIDVANRSVAYVSLMHAKEDAGIERAVLSNTFGAGRFSPGMYARLLGLVALQEDALSTFHIYGGDKAWEQYLGAMRGEFVEATRAMCDAAIAGGDGAVPATDPKVWFAQQTEKIDAMWKVESWLAEDILQTSAELAHGARRALVGALAVMMAVVLLTFLLAWLVVRSIVRPLGQAVEVLGAVGEGDFTCRLELDGDDELGRMARSLNQAVDAVHAAFGDVRAASRTVADAAQQISVASEEIAGGAQRQASGLEETAATLEEITQTVRQNSENAAQASELAVRSRETAERGGKVVGDTVAAMGQINDASRRINDIITTIDEIAFQTNLLALNAAVEAARAGEHGRGFAVVAHEVRDLSRRCSGAAREIKALIEDSVRKVALGSEMASRSGRTLEDIVESVKRVTAIVGEIAAASREQASGIEQVNRAVSEMDEATQGSAAQTEELSGTAEQMAGQAEQLRALVDRFKLADDGEAFPATPAASSAGRPVGAPVSVLPPRSPRGRADGGRRDARQR